MEHYTQYIRHMLYWLVGTAILGTLLLLLVGGTAYITGWLWGCLTNLIYFFLLAIHARKLAKLPLEAARQQIRAAFIGRFVFVIAMTVIATRLPGVHLLAVLIGVIASKPLIILEVCRSLIGRNESV